MLPRAAVVANPTKINIDELKTSLVQLEHLHGWAPSLVLTTTEADAGSSQTREALAAGVDLIIAAGGDGTVRLVLEEAAHSGVSVAIVPAGTGNLLARNLGLERRDHTEALTIAFSGRERTIDLAKIVVERPDHHRESFVFAVIAGIGIDAGMIEHTHDGLKKKIGWPAYLGGIARWLLGSGAFNARYRIGEGRTYGTRASTLMIGNCGLLTGGLVLLPEAKLDDGILDMVVMRPRGPMGWFFVLAGVISRGLRKQVGRLRWREQRGHKRNSRQLAYYQDEQFVFRVDSEPEAFELDGDACGELVAAHAWVLPDAVTVRVPA